MGIVLFLGSIGFFLLGGGVSAAAGRRLRFAGPAASGAALLASLLGLAAGLQVLLSGAPAALSLPWRFPYGSFHLEIDGLSAFFLLPVTVVIALAGLYYAPYRRMQEPPEAHPGAGRPPGSLQGLWFNLLAAGILLVLAAHNGILFLLSWELMSLASFFLVMTHGEREPTLRAGWNYLMATHLGMAFLLVLFLLLGRGQAAFGFAGFQAAALRDSAVPPGILFLLAVIGFGTKAGFVPLHVWLPDAHPAAPSPVSAVMSGVMIKTGIYGLLRTLTFLGRPEPWWGWLLLGVGAVSGLLGVLHALAQHDLKRLLAYHSVENIGIIALGLGLGLLGLSCRLPVLAALGFSGALLHVLNHALFKSLLFLGAGAVDCAAGTRELEHLGGLLKRMPFTGVSFLLGDEAAAAPAGRPVPGGRAAGPGRPAGGPPRGGAAHRAGRRRRRRGDAGGRRGGGRPAGSRRRPAGRLGGIGGLARPDPADRPPAPAGPARQTGADRGHLGLRLRGAHRADAVHRLLFRPRHHPLLPAPPACQAAGPPP